MWPEQFCYKMAVRDLGHQSSILQTTLYFFYSIILCLAYYLEKDDIPDQHYINIVRTRILYLLLKWLLNS